ncbi:MAG: hypothetical protein IKB73_01070 [Ruminococcus sp.]|nr:hypothetical protein [Ruminococcus sp.]
MKFRLLSILAILICLCFVLCSCNNKKEVATANNASKDSATTSSTTDVSTINELPPDEIDTIVEYYNNSIVGNITENKNYTESNGYVRSLSKYARTVKSGDYSYVADENGIRQVDSKGNEKELTKTNATSIATDGKTILFVSNTYPSDTEYDYTSKVFQIRSINTSGKDEKVLAECTGMADPVMIYDNKLYFTDDSTEQYSHQGLFVTDLDSKETKMLEKGLVNPLTIDTKFYYICRDTHFDTYGTLKSFDYTTGTAETLSDLKTGDTIDCYDGKFYFPSTKLENESENTIYCYDPQDNSINSVFTDNSENMTFLFVSDNYLFYGTNESGILEYYATSIDGTKKEKIGEALPEKTHNCVTVTKNTVDKTIVKAFDGEKFVEIDAPSRGLYDYIGQIFFSFSNDDMGPSRVIVSKTK